MYPKGLVPSLVALGGTASPLGQKQWGHVLKAVNKTVNQNEPYIFLFWFGFGGARQRPYHLSHCASPNLISLLFFFL
jgi:hypothetical protein